MLDYSHNEHTEYQHNVSKYKVALKIVSIKECKKNASLIHGTLRLSHFHVHKIIHEKEKEEAHDAKP